MIGAAEGILEDCKLGFIVDLSTSSLVGLKERVGSALDGEVENPDVGDKDGSIGDREVVVCTVEGKSVGKIEGRTVQLCVGSLTVGCLV